MVTDELTDGRRIGQLFSSEVHGHERGALGGLRVADADREVDPTEAGAFAFAVESEGCDRIAEAYVHPDRLRVEFTLLPGTAAEAGRKAGLRTRPKAIDPPRTLLFVERGADVKAALAVLRTVAEERLDETG